MHDPVVTPDIAFRGSERLQRKARAKFGAGNWWFTERALQQSTPHQVASLKASWFGDVPVADLCCGIGGDAMRLAMRGPTIAIDSDPTMVMLARANCDELGELPHRIEFICDDAVDFASRWSHAVHIDPDRRPDEKRTSSPGYYHPAWRDVATIVQRSPSAVVKLAPAAIVESSQLAVASHRTWISLRGSVREQSLLVGKAMELADLPPDTLSAIVVRGDATFDRFVAQEDGARVSTVDGPSQWIIDPDAAIRAGGLTDSFALRHGMNAIGAPSGFLTSSHDVSSLAMATVGRIEWSGSSDERKLKREMRSHGVYAAVVKLRGVQRDPEKNIRATRNCGDRPVTLWMGAVGKKVYAVWTSGPRA